MGVNPRLHRGRALENEPGGGWLHIRQNKHHRWSLDEAQIYQYNLAGALHPKIRWWEAMDVPRRSLQLLQVGEITIASLVCEDLAQNDGVAEIIRSVGPSIVVAVLLDGPQLTSRWAARYASVLADDPGSAVLTLTSYGMVQRSRPPGHDPSSVVALWKDPERGTREISLEPGAHGVILTLSGDRATRRSADGRWPLDTATRYFDAAVHQIQASDTGSGSANRPSRSPNTAQCSKPTSSPSSPAGPRVSRKPWHTPLIVPSASSPTHTQAHHGGPRSASPNHPRASPRRSIRSPTRSSRPPPPARRRHSRRYSPQQEKTSPTKTPSAG